MPPRAKPFSGKQKKLQLQEKRQSKRQESDSAPWPSTERRVPAHELKVETTPPHYRKNKLISDWEPRGAPTQIKAYENPLYSSPTPPVNSEHTTINISKFYEQTSVTIPVRPIWSSTMSKEELGQNEESYFNEWLKHVYQTYPQDQLGFFEHNLEVWRQFWRVCELSDMIVVVLDARFPIIHYPLSIHHYLTFTLKKPFIIVLMKCDLLEESFIEAWKLGLESFFSRNMQICTASMYDLPIDNVSRLKRHQKRYFEASGVSEILNVCRSMTGNRHPDEWSQLIKRDVNDCAATVLDPDADDCFITIGMLGHPNVGKSSLINSIFGSKVVSASRTPGHTKHFQTIHLSKHIRLCDCPGLIFPTALSRNVQILNGLYNVAQVRDPFGPIYTCCSMIDLPSELNLNGGSLSKCWTVLSICESFAIQRGFYTSKAGRPDIQRAANLILRFILDGRVLVAWRTLGYTGPIARSIRRAESSDSDDSDKMVRVDIPYDGEIATLSNPFSILSDN